MKWNSVRIRKCLQVATNYLTVGCSPFDECHKVQVKLAKWHDLHKKIVRAEEIENNGVLPFRSIRGQQMSSLMTIVDIGCPSGWSCSKQEFNLAFPLPPHFEMRYYPKMLQQRRCDAGFESMMLIQTWITRRIVLTHKISSFTSQMDLGLIISELTSYIFGDIVSDKERESAGSNCTAGEHCSGFLAVLMLILAAGTVPMVMRGRIGNERCGGSVTLISGFCCRELRVKRQVGLTEVAFCNFVSWDWSICKRLQDSGDALKSTPVLPEWPLVKTLQLDCCEPWHIE